MLWMLVALCLGCTNWRNLRVMCGIGEEAPYGNEDPTPLALANIYDNFIAESVSADLRRYFEAKLFFKKAYDTNITLAKQASSNLWVDGLANTLAV